MLTSRSSSARSFGFLLVFPSRRSLFCTCVRLLRDDRWGHHRYELDTRLADYKCWLHFPSCPPWCSMAAQLWTPNIQHCVVGLPTSGVQCGKCARQWVSTLRTRQALRIFPRHPTRPTRNSFCQIFHVRPLCFARTRRKAAVHHKNHGP